MSGPIIVGTDGSEPATAAVRWAADEAARRDLPLSIVHVREPWSYGTVYYPAPGVLDELAGVGEQVLAGAAEIAREGHPGLEVQTRLEFGRIAETLRTEASKGTELVVGHRGLGGFTGLLLGAIGLRVAGHAHSPVVVVRGDTTGTQGEVTVGIDPGEYTHEVLTYAFTAAASRGDRLRIVYGWQIPPMYLESGYLPRLDEIEQTASSSLKVIADEWRVRYPDVEVIEETVREHPVRALADASAHADLIVVGSSTHSGLGSISHGLIHHADCPVAVITTLA
jgi:nucleotide-binding universal stress UspA family protein